MTNNSKILVTYVSKSGSTAEIARFIAQEIESASRLAVDVLPMGEVSSLEPYGTVIAGGFLYRFGWHPQAQEFVTRYQAQLEKRKTAFFVAGMGLIKTTECDQSPIPLFLDANFVRQPSRPGRLSALEKQMTLPNYMKDTLPLLAKIHPVSVGFFGGKLDMQTLSSVERMILRAICLLTGAKPGDYRNWDLIREWTGQIALNLA